MAIAMPLYDDDDASRSGGDERASPRRRHVDVVEVEREDVSRMTYRQLRDRLYELNVPIKRGWRKKDLANYYRRHLLPLANENIDDDDDGGRDDDASPTRGGGDDDESPKPVARKTTTTSPSYSSSSSSDGGVGGGGIMIRPSSYSSSSYPSSSSILASHPVIIGLLLRLLLAFVLPSLFDDGRILRGVKYTDVDYDVYVDASRLVSSGMSPYGRHTYRYTPFLASLLSFSHHRWAFPDMVLSSSRYFGRVLFCLADVFCGYIVVRLRRHRRRLRRGGGENDEVRTASSFSSPDLIHALWWMYNPLPINICTRGSAESLVVLLPVLASVAFALGGCDIDDDAERTTTTTTTTGKEEDEDGKSSSYPILARACLSGIFHGIGMHAKLYPVIYTVSFMAYFSRQGERTMMPTRTTKATTTTTFPWRHPTRIARLAIAWVRRLFFTPCSIAFLLVSMGTAGTLTYLAVRNYGREALDEGLLYHLRRVDHRHNYSMYWYWIYLARGRAESASSAAPVWSRLAGLVPLVPQVLILGFSSLGIAPYDLTFALFCQTFAFVAFNKVITAQYFVWYLCLLPLCSSRVIWHTRRMHMSLAVLIFTIVTWLLSAFTLEMLGWRSHRMVWMASLLFFVANVNLLLSIMDGYVGPSSRRWGVDDRAAKKKKVKAS